MAESSLLTIRDLHLEFKTFDGVAKVLVGVNLTMPRGDVLGLVGETGCGKSLTALSVAGLIPKRSATITQGTIHFKGENLLTKSDGEMQRFRAHHLGMIFQDPTTNLNPLFTIREQLIDAVLFQKAEIEQHIPGRFSPLTPNGRRLRREAHDRAVELMRLVGIPDGDKRINEYPHQFSGGMRQRVLIAMALAGEPDLLIADEPTTALDVTIQAQILRLIQDLVDRLDLSVLLITHNLGVVAKLCDHVAVMYAGRVIEYAPVRDLYKNPQHPYTQGLLNAVPTKTTDRGGLQGIDGMIPNLLDPPQGCRFHTRCPHVMDICRQQVPQEASIDDNHTTHCHLFTEQKPEAAV